MSGSPLARQRGRDYGAAERQRAAASGAARQRGAPVVLARAHLADLGAGEPAEPGILAVAVAALAQPVDLVLREGGHGDALDAVRDGLVPRLAVAADECVELDAGALEAVAVLRGAVGALLVWCLLTQRIQLLLQVAARHGRRVPLTMSMSNRGKVAVRRCSVIDQVIAWACH